MQFLRQNTAVMVIVGPFYDKTDGVTIETGLTITNERITLTAATDDGSAPTNILDNITGATAATANDLNYITGNDAGMMQLELAAADTNRVGRMLLSITDAANHVPVFHEYFLLPQAIYDWLTGVIVPLPSNMTQILGTAVATPATAGLLDVNVKQISTDGTAADNAELMFDGTGYAGGTTKLGVDAVALSGDSVAADNAESFFDGTGYAGTGNTIPTVTTLTNANPTAAAVADAVWDEDATAHQTLGSYGQAIGDPVADTNTIYKAVVTDATGATVGVDVVAVKADTAAIGAAGAGLTALATQASVNTIDDFLDTEIAALVTDVAAILVDTGTTLDGRIPAALVGGRIDASVGAMAANVMTAAAAAADLTTELQSGLSTLTAAQVNAEVVDALATDTYAEPGQGAPAATATLAAKINYLFKWARNRITQTATTLSIFADDATTVDQKATVSDDGTTYDRGELGTGP